MFCCCFVFLSLSLSLSLSFSLQCIFVCDCCEYLSVCQYSICIQLLPHVFGKVMCWVLCRFTLERTILFNTYYHRPHHSLSISKSSMFLFFVRICTTPYRHFCYTTEKSISIIVTLYIWVREFYWLLIIIKNF